MKERGDVYVKRWIRVKWSKYVCLSEEQPWIREKRGENVLRQEKWIRVR